MILTIYSHDINDHVKDFPIQFLVGQSEIRRIEPWTYAALKSKETIELMEASDVVMFHPGANQIPLSLITGYSVASSLLRQTQTTALSRFLHEKDVILKAIEMKKKVIILASSTILTLLEMGLNIYENVEKRNDLVSGKLVMPKGMENNDDKSIYPFAISRPIFTQDPFIFEESPRVRGLKVIVEKRVHKTMRYEQPNCDTKLKHRDFTYKEPIVLHSKELNTLFIKQIPLELGMNGGKQKLNSLYYEAFYSMIEQFISKENEDKINITK